LAPAVLRVLADVIEACREADTQVTLCGEMAGQPRSFLVLLGLGLRSFSMSPGFVPSIKELASLLSTETADKISTAAVGLRTTALVKRYLAGHLQSIAPSFGILESQ
jgi:phosphotransferase system enzyme I (PtsI)